MKRQWSRSFVRTARGGAVALIGATLALSTVFVAAPAGASNQSVRFTVTRVAFGSVTLGTSTTAQSIVTNKTGQPLYFISATPSNDSTGAEYHGSAGSCTGALAPGATCNVSVVFAPNQAGLRASTLSVRFGEKNAKGDFIAAATVGAALIARGILPTFTLSNANAGNVMLGQTGAEEATITNTSFVPLTVNAYSLSGVVNKDFKVTAVSCPSPLLPGGSCGIDATFSPAHLGAASATLAVSMLVAGSKSSTVGHQSTLSGTGVTVTGNKPPFHLSPLNFGEVTIGTTATGFVALTNTSKRSETFVKDSIAGNPPAFAVTGNNCPAHIAPGATCDLTVTFTPAFGGTRNATLAAVVTFINAKAVTVSAKVQTSLTGAGIAPTFSLAADKFPVTTVGASSNGLVTVTNTSLVPLTFSSASFQGADQASWALAGTACSGPIGAGASCTINLAFSPRGQGTHAVTLLVVLNQTVRSHTTTVQRRVAVIAHAILPTFKVVVPTLPSTPKGVPVSDVVSLTNTSSVSLSFDGYQFSGPHAADFAVTSTTCSGLIGPTGSCDLTVRFTPSQSSPGTEHAILKVVMAIAGTSPLITTAKNSTISGTES